MGKFKMIYLVFGILISIVAVVLACVWFGWKLALVIFLSLWGNNISNNTKV